MRWLERGVGEKPSAHSFLILTSFCASQAKEGHVDIIIALTEGLVSDIAKGLASRSESEDELKLLATYVESPLKWAISTGSTSDFHDVESLDGAKWGVSRMTSGSHLMALVLGHQRGWNLEAMQFEPLGSFESLRNGVNRGTAAAFMWETFTTKPYHDSGEVRRIGEITTPWPCFMIASTAKKSNDPASALAITRALAAVREACALFVSEKDQMPKIIADKYGLKKEDAEAWYKGVKISASPLILQSSLARALSTLKEAKVISTDNPCRAIDLIDTQFATLETRDIKSMRLYNRPELITRTYNELKAHGWSHGPLDWKELGAIDQQHHYHGAEAVEAAIERSGINAQSTVISLGSGLGGPARYIAGKTGASVLAVEMQPDLSQVAEELTERVSLPQGSVTHLAANFLSAQPHLRINAYDAIVSWLTVLHIPERAQLLSGCRELLTSSASSPGIFYTEDWYRKGEFTAAENSTLREDVYCTYLPTKDEYLAQLKAAGFGEVEFEDLTDDWSAYVEQRVKEMETKKKELVDLHGIDLYDRLNFFYSRVRDLFSGGSLGGARIVAKNVQ